MLGLMRLTAVREPVYGLEAMNVEELRNGLSCSVRWLPCIVAGSGSQKALFAAETIFGQALVKNKESPQARNAVRMSGLVVLRRNGSGPDF
jgi:hypothetical protein